MGVGHGFMVIIIGIRWAGSTVTTWLNYENFYWDNDQFLFLP